jgi:hypothetical protein
VRGEVALHYGTLLADWAGLEPTTSPFEAGGPSNWATSLVDKLRYANDVNELLVGHGGFEPPKLPPCILLLTTAKGWSALGGVRAAGYLLF